MVKVSKKIRQENIFFAEQFEGHQEKKISVKLFNNKIRKSKVITNI